MRGWLQEKTRKKTASPFPLAAIGVIYNYIMSLSLIKQLELRIVDQSRVGFVNIEEFKMAERPENPPKRDCADSDSNRGRPSNYPKIVQFDELTDKDEEIWIENNGQIYRLRRTKQGKLILTK